MTRADPGAPEPDNRETPDLVAPFAAGAGERLKAVAPPLLIDLILPYGVFFVLSRLGVPAVAALALGGVAPAVRAVLTYVRSRKVEGLALFVLTLFALGIVMALVTGDPRLLLAKESLFTGGVGVVCVISLMVGRPLMYYVRREISSGDARQWERVWQASVRVRRSMRRTTLAWGVSLIVEAVALVFIAYTFPLDTAAALTPAVNVGLVATLVTFTHIDQIWLNRQLTRLQSPASRK